MRGTLAVLTAAAIVATTTRGLANGRYPNAQQLLVDPGNPDHLVLRATFGILDSTDGGASWSWICEQAVGYMGDPSLVAFSGGRLLAAFQGVLAFSSDGGCGWQSLSLPAETRFPIDVTLDVAEPSRAWVVTISPDARQQVSLLRTDGSGVTTLPVADGLFPSTLEVARSRPERVYVMGTNAESRAVTLVTDDGGQTFRELLVDWPGSPALYISAVDPLDPDVIYARADDLARDTLLVSRDGAQTWREIFAVDGEMLGFALSPDGTRVAIGGPAGVGLWVADTASFDFQPRAPLASVQCLTWTERGLFACATERDEGWTIGLSTDAGASFSPVWHIQDLRPLECELTSSTGAVCPTAWLEVASSIGAELVPDSDPEPAQPAAAGDDGCTYGVAARGAPSAWLSLLGLAALGGGTRWRTWRRWSADRAR